MNIGSSRLQLIDAMASAGYFQRIASVPASSWASAVAALPVMIWIHDSFFSLCRVKGSSMTPTLQDGDVVIIRKADGFFWKRNPNEDTERLFERQALQKWEQTHCSQPSHSPILQKPPVPLTGEVVVYKDPETYQSRWNIKRVIGLGGQVVSTSTICELSFARMLVESVLYVGLCCFDFSNQFLSYCFCC